MESSWLESYYESLEFLYWEPQHMRPKAQRATEVEALANKIAKSSKAEEVMRHLRKMEVTLNYNMRQFFLLAPAALRNSLFADSFARPFDGRFVTYGREIDKEFKLANCMQPDFLFVSETDVVSIEMKVGGKSSIDQVLKYALLGLAVELREGKTKRHFLMLLASCDDLSGQFPDFHSTGALMDKVRESDLDTFMLKKPVRFRKQQQRLAEILKELHLEFVNYERLARILSDVVLPESDRSPGAEVYRNLISGLLKEFEIRKLIVPLSVALEHGVVASGSEQRPSRVSEQF